MRRLLSALLLITILLGIVSCAEEKRYGHCEVELPLPDSFESYDSGGTYDAAYSDGRMIVGIMRLSFAACVAEGISTAMSPSRFGEYYRKRALSDVAVSDMLIHGDVPYYTYTIDNDGVKYLYLASFYFTPYAYVVVTYIVPESGYNSLREEILSYAQGLRIVPYTPEK